MSFGPSVPQLLATAPVVGIVAAFYYTTQRSEVHAATTKPIPFSAERKQVLAETVRTKSCIVAAILGLHTPLTLLFFLGTIDAFLSIDISGTPHAGKVAVAVIAGLSAVHAWLIGADLRSLLKRRRDLRVK